MTGPVSGDGGGVDEVDGLVVRPATPADAAVVAAHRVAMFRDMGRLAGDVGDPAVGDPAVGDALARATVDYLETALADGGYVGWLGVDAAGTVVAGAGVQLRPIMPRPGPGGQVLTAPQAHLLNVYTEPAWRRRGVAALLVRRALAWAEARGCSSVLLHASDAGRALYERLGFRPTNEMQFHGAPIFRMARPDPRRSRP